MKPEVTTSNISPTYQIDQEQQLRIKARYNATQRHTGTQSASSQMNHNLLQAITTMQSHCYELQAQLCCPVLFCAKLNKLLTLLQCREADSFDVQTLSCDGASLAVICVAGRT